jgi:thioesterase domain-containing protein
MQNAGERLNEPVIALQARGDRVPLFLVDPGTEAQGLLRALGPSRPLYGIRLPDLERFPDLCKVEDLAKFCARAILMARPAGPYALYGWCAEGILAVEIARALEREGGEVAFTVIVDARNVLPPMSPLRRLLVRGCRLYQRTRFFLSRLLQDGMDPLRIAGNSRLVRARKRQRRVFLRLPRRDHSDLLLSAVAGYCPLPYSGRMVHIWASERPRGWSQDPEFLYRHFSPVGFAFYEIPGGHISMFSERNIAALGQILASEIDDATAALPLRVSKPAV